MSCAPRHALALVVLALVAFAVPAHATPGGLNFLESYADTGAGGARSVAIAPDGTSVYLAGQDSDAVVGYSRDGTTGLLTLLGCIEDTGTGGGCGSTTDGLISPRYMALSDAGDLLYVTGGGSDAIVVLSRNTGTGVLTPGSCFWSPAAGTCTTPAGLPTGALDDAEGIFVREDFVYVAAQTAGTLLVFSGATSGTLVFEECFSNAAFAGCTTVAGALDHPRELTINDDGTGLYVASATSDGVAQFARDDGTGLLTPLSPALVGGVDLPVGITATPDDAYVYVSAVNDNAVAIYQRDPATAKLTFAGCIRDVGGGGAACTSTAEGLAGSEDVAFSGDSASLYATGMFDDAVATFARNGTDLTPLGCLRENPGGGGCGTAFGIGVPHGLEVSPDSRHVYVAGGSGDTISVYGCGGTHDSFAAVESPFKCVEDLIPAGTPACTVTPGWFGETAGPVGVIDDGSRLFVANGCDQNLYRYMLDGTFDAMVPNGIDRGLLLHDGHYYGLASATAPPPDGPGLYEFDPTTLAVGSRLAAVVGAVDVKADPVTGDLFISSNTGSDGSIVRVHDPSGTPVVTPFAGPVVGRNISGLGFNGDGSLLYGAARLDHVFAWDRTGAQTPFDVTIAARPEGIYVAPPSTVLNGVDVSDNVFTNNNGLAPDTGTISRIDVHNGNAVHTIATQGSRGHVFAVDPNGMLLAPQSDRVIRLSPGFTAAPAVAPTSSGLLPPAGPGGQSPPPVARPAQLPDIPTPIALQTGNVDPVSGIVLVRLPGTQLRVRIETVTSVPVGTLIDARNGVVRLTVARSLKSGRLQTGLFSRGSFYFNQEVEKLRAFGKPDAKVFKSLVTELRLVGGGSVKTCPKGSAGQLQAGPRRGAAAKRRFVRYLQAQATGRFRVIGRQSSGLERGTDWLTRDDCTGTLTRVDKGAVVVTDFAKGKDLLVRKGNRYLATGRASGR